MYVSYSIKKRFDKSDRERLDTKEQYRKGKQSQNFEKELHILGTTNGQ